MYYFMISGNGILDIKKWFLDIKNGYQEIKFLISRTGILTISWYQEIWFLDIKKWFLDIKNTISWYQNMNLFLDIKNSISWYQEILINSKTEYVSWYEEFISWYQEFRYLLCLKGNLLFVCNLLKWPFLVPILYVSFFKSQQIPPFVC